MNLHLLLTSREVRKNGVKFFFTPAQPATSKHLSQAANKRQPQPALLVRGPWLAALALTKKRKQQAKGRSLGLSNAPVLSINFGTAAETENTHRKIVERHNFSSTASTALTPTPHLSY